MDVTAQHILCIGQDGAHVVGENELCLAALAAEQIAVIFHIVHACERVLFITEQLAVARLGQHVAPGVYALFVQKVLVEQVVAHFIRGVAHQDIGLFEGFGNALQADGNAVAAEDREGEAHRVGAEFGGAVLCDGIGGGIVALASGHNGLCDGHDVFILKRNGLFFAAGENGIGDDFDKVVALTNDRAAHAAGSGADSSHMCLLLLVK